MTEETIQQPGEAIEPVVIPIEDQINQELVKHNVTEALIADLKEKYLPLKLKDLNDKETYVIIKEARKECKTIRVTAEKLCKKGREDANAIQKAWIAKEKDVAGRIGEVEDHLEAQEKAFEAEQEKIKAQRKRQQEEQLIRRQTQLTNMGALYSDGSFFLGEVSFELSLIKECEDDIWAEQIFPKYHAEYEKIEAERLEADRKKQEHEAELKRQQEEMERKRRELEEREAALKKAEEDRLQKEQDEKNRIAAEAEVKKKAEISRRISELEALDITFRAGDYYYKGAMLVESDVLVNSNGDEWSKKMEAVAILVADAKKYAEEKRLAELEEQKKAVAEEAARKERLRIEEEQRLAEIKRKQEEEKKAEELAAAGDKDKWSDILRQIDTLEIHEMRSGQYRKKAAILREKMEEIKAL